MANPAAMAYLGNMPDVFAYTSYAKFLKDFYQEKKLENPRFSYETLSRKAGFKSRSNIMEVAAGKKELSKSKIFSVAQALDLGPKESEYFESLVHFNDATTLKEREFHLGKLGMLVGKPPGAIIGEGQFAYFSEWQHPVIRELICMRSFDGDLGKLAKTLQPQITVKQVKESIELLLRLGLLEKLPHGRYRQSHVAIQTEDELSSFTILRYQKENLRLAEEALDGILPEDRDISTFTAGISKKCFLSIKKEIQAFRRHLSSLVEKDAGEDRVYQLNLQFFPVSDTKHGKG